jgi:hypothetical protein
VNFSDLQLEECYARNFTPPEQALGRTIPT